MPQRRETEREETGGESRNRWHPPFTKQTPWRRFQRAASWAMSDLKSFLGFLGKCTLLWLGSRDYRQVLLGVPSLVLAVVFVFVAFAGQCVRESDLVAEYYSAAADAYHEGETRAAELWLRKVARLAPQNRETRYDLAITVATHEDYERASQMMRGLAPDEGIGFGPAHLWRAGELMRTLEPTDERQVALIRHHLKIALQGDAEQLAARELLGRLELSQENLPAAIEHYRYLEESNTAYAIVLARLHLLQGERDAAVDVADRGIRYFQGRVEKDGGDVESRIEWARLEGLLGNFERATQILLAGVQREPAASPKDLNRLRVELGNAFHGWAEFARQTNPDDVAQRLEHLQLGLKFAPDNTQILERLAELTRSDTPEAQAAHDLLTDSLVDGTATPMVHFVLAVAAFERGEFGREQQHLELALAGDPGLVVAANNLAWRLAVSDPPQLEKAFHLINQAITKAPKRLEFRATRGRIHQLLGRPTEAIVDLEAALAGLKDRPDIHEALADLYQQLGNTELARRHRARAEKIEAALSDKSQGP